MYIKKQILYGVILLFCFLLVFNSSFVQAKMLSYDECMKQFKDEVINDVKSSFPELKVIDNSQDYVQEFTYSDVHKAMLSMLAIGNPAASYLQPVYQLFKGNYLGEPRFFVVQSKNIIKIKQYKTHSIGFFLYKKPDGNNGMLKIIPRKTDWDIVDKKETKSEIILWKCGK